MNNNGKVILALLAGAAAGVALGILFAPEKGSETRNKIMDSAGDLVDAIKEKAGSMMGGDSDSFASNGNGKSGSYSSSKKQGQNI